MTDAPKLFLSLLSVDAGENPQRPRPGRQWVRNPYRIHQRLAWAMDGVAPPGSNARPAAIGTAKGAGRILFRIFPAGLGQVSPGYLPAQLMDMINAHKTRLSRHPQIVVLSEHRPNWQQAFATAPFLLANKLDEVPVVQYAPRFEVGAQHKFMLLANPVVNKTRLDAEGQPLRDASGKRARGSRKAWPKDEDAAKGWLKPTFDGAGAFEIVHAIEVERTPLLAWKKDKPELKRVNGVRVLPKDGSTMRLPTVTFVGVLRVANSTLAAKALGAGVGPAKSLGCGMLVLGSKCSPD